MYGKVKALRRWLLRAVLYLLGAKDYQPNSHIDVNTASNKAGQTRQSADRALRAQEPEVPKKVGQDRHCHFYACRPDCSLFLRP